MAAEKNNMWDNTLATVIQKMDIISQRMATKDDLKEQANSFKEDLIRVEDKLENKIGSVDSGLKAEMARFESSIKAEISRLESVLKDTIKLEVKASTASLTTKVNFIISVIMLFAVPAVGYMVSVFLKQYFPWG